MREEIDFFPPKFISEILYFKCSKCYLNIFLKVKKLFESSSLMDPGQKKEHSGFWNSLAFWCLIPQRGIQKQCNPLGLMRFPPVSCASPESGWWHMSRCPAKHRQRFQILLLTIIAWALLLLPVGFFPSCPHVFCSPHCPTLSFSKRRGQRSRPKSLTASSAGSASQMWEV